MATLIYCNSSGVIVSTITSNSNSAANDIVSENLAPSGQTVVEVSDGSAQATNPAQWKYTSASFVQKTKIALSLSGLVVKTTPAVTCTVRVGPFAVAVTNGVGTVSVSAWPTSVPGYAVFIVDPADPNYYSDPEWA